jgi:hypothetical protein
MEATRATFIAFVILLIGLIAHSQTPSTDTKHFEKDGLSFDYPANWQVNDQSTQQMQAIQVTRGDGFAELRVRVPREWLKTPQKEAEAKRIIQDHYVEQFVDSVQQAGLHPTRAAATTEIAGGTAEGVKIRAVLGDEPGGMDSFYRVVSERFVQLSQLGSEREMTKSLPAWDMIRNSIKVEAPPQPKPSPQPSPKTSTTPSKP